MGFLNSLGLIQRTKKGWQAPSVRISSSSDRLNWLLSVGERFLVSAPWGGWTTEMGGADLRPSTLPEGKLEGRAVGSGPKGELPRKVGWPSNWGYLVTLLVWAWSSDPSCTPSGDHPGT